MSTLIDDLLELKNCNQEFEGKWYIAKPFEFYGFLTFLNRIRDAYRVLTGKSRAYHFYEDELAERPLIVNLRVEENGRRDKEAF